MAQSKRLITSTITADLLLHIGEDMLTKTPYEMMKTVEEHFAADTSPENHDRLLDKARKMTIKAGETIDEYIERHLKMRREMRRAGYPAIRHEATTNNFIFRGLTARPPLAVHVPMMLAQRPPTVREARRLIELVAGSASSTARASPSDTFIATNIWCEFHKRFTESHYLPSAAQCSKHKPKCIDRIQHKARPLPPDARVASRDRRAAAACLAHGAEPATGDKRTLRSTIQMTAQITGMMHLTLLTLPHSNKSPLKPRRRPLTLAREYRTTTNLNTTTWILRATPHSARSPSNPRQLA